MSEEEEEEYEEGTFGWGFYQSKKLVKIGDTDKLDAFIEQSKKLAHPSHKFVNVTTTLLESIKQGKQQIFNHILTYHMEDKKLTDMTNYVIGSVQKARCKQYTSDFNTKEKTDS
jgi:hypothetical protein